MPIAKYRNYKIHYEFNDEGDGPVIIFINGIIQSTAHWVGYREQLKQFGIRTISFDQLGQGASDHPVLDYDFEENPDIVAAVLDACKVKKAYIAGISFGGTIVLKFALKYPDRCAGLIPMSTFSELDSRLLYMGTTMWDGMIRVGFEYILDQLIPINFSSRFISALGDNLKAIRRNAANVNDLFGIQNLIESIRNMPMEGFTAELPKIKAPTLILNAEHDPLTPRWCHEVIRKNIKNSRLMFIQHAYHAFSVELPDVTIRILREFIQSVENGTWSGDQTAWIATDDAKSEQWCFPCVGDHTRSIPIMAKPAETTPAAPAKSEAKQPSAAPAAKPAEENLAKTAAKPKAKTTPQPTAVKAASTKKQVVASPATQAAAKAVTKTSSKTASPKPAPKPPVKTGAAKTQKKSG